MAQQTEVSEVARLMQRISLEHQAACFALTSPTITSKHWFITRRMRRIDTYHQELAALVGEQASIALVAQVFEQSPQSPAQQQGALHE